MLERCSILLFGLLSCGFPARAEIIDRIAVVVGNNVITEREVLQQIRLAAFQNGEKPDFSAQSRRDAADKLVDQALIRKEIDATRLFVGAPAITSEQVLAQLRSRYPAEAAYQAALREYEITGEQVKKQVAWQMTLIPFVDTRFKPGIQVSELALREYYDNEFMKDWKTNHTGPPPSVEEARDTIESILSSQRADQALDRWIGQTRTQTRIIYKDEAFQ